jgi:hypothetical protein
MSGTDVKQEADIEKSRTELESEPSVQSQEEDIPVVRKWQEHLMKWGVETRGH